MSTERNINTIIIGAGITGLTAAYYLQKKTNDFMVLEEQDRVGGVIQTVRENGFLYETGPNTGVLGQPEAALLFEDLDRNVELELANEAVNKRYILKNGKWEPLPAGLSQAITTPLFSLKDKFRILLEPFRARGKNPEETLEELVIRRMGKSYLDYAIDPFILGVYAGDPHTLVPKYALPKLYRLEQDYGSFIGGAIKKKFIKQTDQEKKATRQVFSVKGGLQSLVDALYRETGPDKFELGFKNIQIHKEPAGYKVTGINRQGRKEEYHTNTILVTTGSHKLPGLLPSIGEKEMAALTDLRYAKVIEVALGFDQWNGIDLDGFGGLIPFKENHNLLGVLFLSAFLENRAPAGGALFTLFLGGVRKSELFQKSDSEITKIVEKEFMNLMGINEFNPALFKIFKHEWAIPQYEKSSGTRFQTIESIEKGNPGLFLRGNFQGGIGLADRIRQGKLAAGSIPL